jgi:translation elongation factor P/translation initiation factor 5A
MKMNQLKYAALAFMPAAILTFTSCSSTPVGTEQVTAVETPEGAIIVDTYKVTATITAIDAETRKVSFTTQGGRKSTYKCGPEVVNFAQLRVGDVVKATLTEEVAVWIGSGEAPSGMAAAGVALAPVGAKPGVVVVGTERVTAKVTAVNVKTHKVTFQLPDGSSKTVKAGSKVNLAAVHVGEDVTVQMGQGLAITVEKP